MPSRSGFNWPRKRFAHQLPQAGSDIVTIPLESANGRKANEATLHLPGRTKTGILSAGQSKRLNLEHNIMEKTWHVPGRR